MSRMCTAQLLGFLLQQMLKKAAQRKSAGLVLLQ
jgi:hypothetical protein